MDLFAQRRGIGLCHCGFIFNPKSLTAKRFRDWPWFDFGRLESSSFHPLFDGSMVVSHQEANFLVSDGYFSSDCNLRSNALDMDATD
jgi:hypothetical protein